MTDRRDILLVVFDSLSPADLAVLADRLPVLTDLGSSALRFTHAYAPSPEGGPARASLFTGLDIAAHGVWTDGVALPERETTLPQRLADHGYRTWLVGRRHLAGVSNWTTEHARSFEFAQLDWAHGPLHRSRQNAYLCWLQETAPEVYARIFPHQADPDDTDIPPMQRAAMADLPDTLAFNTWVGARVCETLAAETGACPFFGIAGFVIGDTMGVAPHAHGPGEGGEARALQQADAALGTILDCLEKQGRADSTALVVTAARGAATDAGRPMQEQAIRVPLMIRASDVAAGEVEPAVSTIDVAPTLYGLAGVPGPRRMQGTSLLGSDDPRGWALARLRHPDHGWQTALCHGQWKLVMAHGDPDAGTPPAYRLYNLYNDPQETSDLALRLPNRLEAMTDLMIDARVALEDRTEPRIASF